ncbi:MAG: hypothetical protein KJZ80_00540 [Hyphomicrobiaceae bacterium]|nr:hypothetical protein [Hyphomicrobiaceae bacterium]
MAVSDPPFTIPVADGGPDDLPRTFRRERAARERQAREARERALAEAAEPAAYRTGAQDLMQAAGSGSVTVTRLEIPLLHLMGFFLKAVFAAVPALIVLGLMVWSAGHALQAWFPDLVKMQILILFPPS